MSRRISIQVDIESGCANRTQAFIVKYVTKVDDEKRIRHN